MNKAFKRYKRCKWINTRFSRQYKFEGIIARAQAATVAAMSASRIRGIRFAEGDPKQKNLAIANAVIECQKSLVSAIMKPENRWRANKGVK